MFVDETLFIIKIAPFLYFKNSTAEWLYNMRAIDLDLPYNTTVYFVKMSLKKKIKIITKISSDDFY